MVEFALPNQVLVDCDSLIQKKKILRITMHERLAALPLQRFVQAGKNVTDRIVSLPIWQEAERILLFLSMKREICTDFLIEQALTSHKAVYAPKTYTEKLGFYQITTLDGRWESDSFGIREPVVTTDAVSLSYDQKVVPTCIIVPGLAFDIQGHRLGRGKGFYDRFLYNYAYKQTMIHTIGLCLSEQVLKQIPVESHDISVEQVITD
jgi:5-formyltetrahydrofolate cyclo-ligase